MAVSRGPAVEERCEYGNLAKEVLRHLAIRQSSLVNVGAVISSMTELQPISSRMLSRATERRLQIDEATKMARSVQPVALNEGQDFDEVFEELVAAVKAEIEWELSQVISAIRKSIPEGEAEARFRSARYVRGHAPTYLSAKGPRWYEHAPVISRLLTFYEHLRFSTRLKRVEKFVKTFSRTRKHGKFKPGIHNFRGVQVGRATSPRRYRPFECGDPLPAVRPQLGLGPWESHH